MTSVIEDTLSLKNPKHAERIAANICEVNVGSYTVTETDKKSAEIKNIRRNNFFDDWKFAQEILH